MLSGKYWFAIAKGSVSTGEYVQCFSNTKRYPGTNTNKSMNTLRKIAKVKQAIILFVCPPGSVSKGMSSVLHREYNRTGPWI